nr:cohesin domain protein [uncultured bacterium]
MIILYAHSQAVHAQEGTLGIGAMRLENDQYSVPIVLNGGVDQVAALNFRLEYDPAVFRPVAAQSGSAAALADKVVTANSPTPGSYVVVMMGLNQSTVSQGEVARVIMERVGQPESGQSELVIQEPTLATPEGTELPSRGMSRTIDFKEAQEEPDTEEPEEVAEGEPEENAPEQDAEDKTGDPDTSPEETALPQGTFREGSGPRQPLRMAENASPEAPRKKTDGEGATVQARTANSPGEDLAQRVEELDRLRQGLEMPAEPVLNADASSSQPAGEKNSELGGGATGEMKVAALPSNGMRTFTQQSAEGISAATASPADDSGSFRYLLAAILVIVGLACGISVIVKSRRSR